MTETGNRSTAFHGKNYPQFYTLGRGNLQCYYSWHRRAVGGGSYGPYGNLRRHEETA